MRGKIKYRRELQKSYMILEGCGKNLIESYCGQMILKNKIKGMAECETRLTEGQREVWYDISSLHTLEQAFTVKEMSHSDLYHLLLQVISIINETEKYLLDARQLCFEPEYLYMDTESGKAAFLFDLTEEKEESSIIKLAEFALERVCHEESSAAELAYFFYDCAKKEQISIVQLQNYMEESGNKQEKSCENRKIETFPVENKIAENKIRLNEEEEILCESSFIREETGERYPEREIQKTAESRKTFFWDWNSKNGKIMEWGLVIVVMALFFAAALLPMQNYFLLTTREQILWIAASALLFTTGIVMSVWAYIRARSEKKRNGNIIKKEERERQIRKETQLWQWEEELPAYSAEKEEAEPTDGKTVYVGKSLLNREYSLIERKKGSEKEYPIPSYPFLIGKEKERVNLVVKEHSVSRIHARLTEEDGNIYVEDLHSTNGTYLNDLTLEPHDRIKLKRGDILQFGKAEFIFQ